MVNFIENYYSIYGCCSGRCRGTPSSVSWTRTPSPPARRASTPGRLNFTFSPGYFPDELLDALVVAEWLGAAQEHERDDPQSTMFVYTP